MKRAAIAYLVLAGVSLGLFTGCEDWTTSVDDWNSTGLINYFSGVYRDAGGDAVVTVYNSTDTTASHSHKDHIATGDGARKSFVGVLTHRPVVKGSVRVLAHKLVTGETCTWFEIDTSGNLETSPKYGNWGDVNYTTGEIELYYEFPPVGNLPADGQKIVVEYRYITSEGTSGEAIYSFTVMQQGNHLQFRDSHGNLYEGKIGDVQVLDSISTAGPWSAIAQFSVRGNYGPVPVEIVGTLEGEVDDAWAPHRVYRRMYGTWMEPGYVANVEAAADYIEYY